MYNFEDACKYILNELPKAGFTPATSGNYFFRYVGGTGVVVTINRLSEDNVSSFCEKITDSVTGFNSTNNPHANAFVFLIPDEEGVFKKSSPAYQTLFSAYEYLSKHGSVVEFDMIDLKTGTVSKIGSGTVDRAISKLLTGLGVASATGKAIPDAGSYGLTGGAEAPENSVTDDNGTKTEKKSTLRFFGASNMIIVYILIALNVIVFFAGMYVEYKFGTDWFTAYGIQSNDAIKRGEFWRLFTAMFLHADLYHLFGNMLSLFYIGMVVSRFFTKIELTVTYFVSGLVGNLLSLAFLPDNVLSLGASGAVMGIGGVLIYMLAFSRNRREFRSMGNFFSLGIMVVYNLVYGVLMTGSNINNFAHFGGFVAGFLIALMIERMLDRKKS
ncbi:MAG: rhomboid family intramembrane serine protease [Clostridia bacterium]|nr:rhomboid family intramembrane serine protease [Clostridia bacterium]